MTTYEGGFKAGDKVTVAHVVGIGVPGNIIGKNGVVASMTDKILAVIQPGEVPVRIAMVEATRMRDEEVAIYLLAPALLVRADKVLNDYEIPGIGSR